MSKREREGDIDANLQSTKRQRPPEQGRPPTPTPPQEQGRLPPPPPQQQHFYVQHNNTVETFELKQNTSLQGLLPFVLNTFSIDDLACEYSLCSDDGVLVTHVKQISEGSTLTITSTFTSGVVANMVSNTRASLERLKQNLVRSVLPTALLGFVGRKEAVDFLLTNLEKNFPPEAAHEPRARKLLYVHGAPGMGKTTLLKHVVEHYNKDDSTSPDVRAVSVSFNAHTQWLEDDEKQIVLENPLYAVSLRLLFAMHDTEEDTQSQDSGKRWANFRRIILSHKSLWKEHLNFDNVIAALRGMLKCQKLVILVDELPQLQPEYVDRVRLALCNCQRDQLRVLFSSVSDEFMAMAESPIINTGRAIERYYLTMLSEEDAIEIINNNLPIEFDGPDKTSFVMTLAGVSGGHPRSIEMLLTAVKGVNCTPHLFVGTVG